MNIVAFKKIFVLLILMFFVTSAWARPSEEEKIEALIAYVKNLDGAVFIRNGSEFSASRAAEHLYSKRKKAGSKVKTARDFIKYVASQSHTTKTPYKIRFKDGRTLTAEEVFLAELERIEKSQDGSL